MICAVLAAVGHRVAGGRWHERAVRAAGGRVSGHPADHLAADAPQAAARKFAAQLPEALELIARALRAGHSLAAGINLVATEMSAPIAVEFGRTFEEQNLGIPMEEALESLTKRVPNLDLKFFSTAIILQRQTGGDLAEILDKIGHLIRERFKIWGQVQALTGEGRLSGIVLLGLAAGPVRRRVSHESRLPDVAVHRRHGQEDAGRRHRDAVARRLGHSQDR